MGKQELITLAGSLIMAIVAWFFGRRQARATAQKTELDTVEQAITIWRSLAQDFKREVDELRVEVALLRTENQSLRGEIDRLVGILEDNGIAKH